MVGVVVLEPSIEKPKHRFGVRQGVHADIVAFEGLHECLGQAVAFWARLGHRLIKRIQMRVAASLTAAR